MKEKDAIDYLEGFQKGQKDLVEWLENFVKMTIFYGDWGGKSAQQYGEVIVKALKAKLKE